MNTKPSKPVDVFLRDDLTLMLTAGDKEMNIKLTKQQAYQLGFYLQGYASGTCTGGEPSNDE